MPPASRELGWKIAAPAEASEEAEELSDDAIGELLDELPALDDRAEDELEPDADDEDGNELASVDDADVDDAEASPLDFGGDAEELLSIPEGDREGDDTADGLFDYEPVPFEEPAKLATDEAEDWDDFHGLPASMPPLAFVDEREAWNEPDALPEQAALGDEPRPALAASPFRDVCPGLALEACSAIASAEGIAAAASTDLLWFGPGETAPIRLDAGSARIHAVALVGTGFEFAICSTTSGKLLRRGRLASASEELRRVREVADTAPGSREALDLCQPGAAFPHTLLARTSSGKLLRSDDDGISFRRVSERRVLALSSRGTPTLAISVEGTLLVSDDGGGSFRELELDEAQARVARAECAQIGGSGSTVVLAHPDFGALVSADRGAEFKRVRGTHGVSAIAVGADQGEDAVFLALFDDAHNRSVLVRVSPSSGHAETIALIEHSASDDDGSESARTLALAWDPSSGKLWAAGGYGVKAFSR